MICFLSPFSHWRWRCLLEIFVMWKNNCHILEVLWTTHISRNVINQYTGWYLGSQFWVAPQFMMTSSNGNIFRVTGHLCGEFTGPRWIPAKPVTRSFDVFFDLRLNKRFSKQWWGWWFETQSRPLWRQCNGNWAMPWLLQQSEPRGYG